MTQSPVPQPSSTSSDPYRSPLLFKRLWKGWLYRYQWWMAFAFGIMLIEGSTLGALSWMLKPLFDKVLAPGSQGSILWVGALIFGLFFIRAVTSITSKSLMAMISLRSATSMQVDLLRHVLTLDSKFFQHNPPGALIERLQGDTMAVQGMWQVLVTGVARDLVSLIGLMVLAVMIDPVWTLAALIGAPLMIAPIVIVQRYIRRKVAAIRQEAGQRATRLDEIFHGIQAVKLNRMETYQVSRFEAIVERLVRWDIKTTAGRAVIPALIDVITGLGFFAVVLLAAPAIMSGERTTGDFMAFFSAMALTFHPLRRLGETAGTWQTAAASLERLFRLFDEKPSPRAPASAKLDTSKGAPDIRLEDVNFSYSPDQPILRGLSLHAPAGKVTALVGPSGAGKTTVFSLLTGMYHPTSGRVLLGGEDIAHFALDDLRSHFAVVSQESALFDETLRENLTLGRDVSEEELRRALDAAHVSPFLQGLDRGLDTRVGPRGSALSGGQRQRVAIARSLVRQTPILLLDEATSALDAHSEAAVGEALATHASGRTTLVIAHRLATIRDADHIVVMDAGRALDQGRHEELLGRCSLYTDLCRLQFQS